MRATSCVQCGRPQVFVRQCIFCGSTKTDFWEDVENQEVADLVRGGQFEEALNLAEQQVQCLPDEAEGYFLRLLARRKCAAVEDLLGKGFNSEDSTDFYSALHLSEGNTREALAGIEAWMQNISRRLISAEDRYLANYRENLHLMDERQRLEGIGQKERLDLFNLYRQIEDVEGDIYQAAKRCRNALSQAERHLADAKKSAQSVFVATRTPGMSKEDYDSWKIQVANVEKAAKAAVAEYDMAKTRYAQEISVPSRRREDLYKAITNRLKKWNEMGDNARDLLQSLEHEKERVNAIKEEIAAGLFSGVAEHLGEDAFFRALKEAGLKSFPKSVVDNGDEF